MPRAPSPGEHLALTQLALDSLPAEKQAQMGINQCYLVCHQTHFLKPKKRDRYFVDTTKSTIIGSFQFLWGLKKSGLHTNASPTAAFLSDWVYYFICVHTFIIKSREG